MSEHEACVDEWLAGIGATSLPRPELVELVDAGFAAIWQRAQQSLGEVMLGAIVDRVLFNGAQQFPQLAKLRVDATGLRFEGLLLAKSDRDPESLVEPLRFLLVALLTVLDHVTGGILTEALCTELMTIKASGQSTEGDSPNAVNKTAATDAHEKDEDGE